MAKVSVSAAMMAREAMLYLLDAGVAPAAVLPERTEQVTGTFEVPSDLSLEDIVERIAGVMRDVVQKVGTNALSPAPELPPGVSGAYLDHNGLSLRLVETLGFLAPVRFVRIDVRCAAQ